MKTRKPMTYRQRRALQVNAFPKSINWPYGAPKGFSPIKPEHMR